MRRHWLALILDANGASQLIGELLIERDYPGGWCATRPRGSASGRPTRARSWTSRGLRQLRHGRNRRAADKRRGTMECFPIPSHHHRRIRFCRLPHEADCAIAKQP